jgi:hypothetical protein
MPELIRTTDSVSKESRPRGPGFSGRNKNQVEEQDQP